MWKLESAQATAARCFSVFTAAGCVSSLTVEVSDGAPFSSSSSSSAALTVPTLVRRPHLEHGSTSGWHRDTCVTAGIHPPYPTAWTHKHVIGTCKVSTPIKTDSGLSMGPRPPDGSSIDLFVKTRCRWTLACLLSDPGNEKQVRDLRSAVTNPIPLGQDQTCASGRWAAEPWGAESALRCLHPRRLQFY